MTKSEQEAAKIDFRKEITIKLFSEAHIEKCRRKFAELSDEEFVALMRKAYELDADPLVGDIYIRRRQRGDTGGFHGDGDHRLHAQLRRPDGRVCRG